MLTSGWQVAHGFSGFLAAVAVGCASQCDTHRCKNGLEVDDRTEHGHQEGQQEGRTVGHPAGDALKHLIL